ncbi:MAG: glycosyltransferase [Thomasclavelia sp.]
MALKENYSLMHCHSPIGGVLARLAFKKSRKQGTRVIYTAHGFHFYDGAPLKNWIIFYPIEKYYSKFTDCLITINKEDYNRAKRNFMLKKLNMFQELGYMLEKFKILMLM